MVKNGISQLKHSLVMTCQEYTTNLNSGFREFQYQRIVLRHFGVISYKFSSIATHLIGYRTLTRSRMILQKRKETRYIFVWMHCKKIIEWVNTKRGGNWAATPFLCKLTLDYFPTRKKNWGQLTLLKWRLYTSHRRTVKTLVSLRIRAVELKVWKEKMIQTSKTMTSSSAW